jgi:hypothetical protein
MEDYFWAKLMLIRKKARSQAPEFWPQVETIPYSK